MLNLELWTYVTVNLLRMLSHVGQTFCLPYCSNGSCASALFLVCDIYLYIYISMTIIQFNYQFCQYSGCHAIAQFNTVQRRNTIIF